MKTVFLALFFWFFTTGQPANVNLTVATDPDIVIINIEKGDRAFIGRVINKINQCNPKVIGIDAWFGKEKGREEDSILKAALKGTDKEILTYIYEDSEFSRSHPKFQKHYKHEGLAMFQAAPNGLTTFITPLSKIENRVHENFVLKLLQQWKPHIDYDYKVEEPVLIMYRRTLRQFQHINGSDLNINLHERLLKDKVVLLGFTGPGKEDKFFTPIRQVIDYPEGEPDTYGVVIIANALRTLAEYNK